MKLIKLLITLIIFTFSTQDAYSYQLDSELSTVSFATIKLSYIVEPAYFGGLNGQIDDSGTLSIQVPISNVSTGIPIRNQRLNELYFLSSVFPHATVSARISNDILRADQTVQQLTIPAIVGIAGKEVEINFSVNVVKVGETLAVSTAVPSVVDAARFGIPVDNLNALSQTVGGIPLSDKVPVSFSLVFTK